MKKIIFSLVLLFLLVSCSNKNGEVDAFGNFESDEILISAENSGKIVSTLVREGEQVSKGTILALVDTVSLSLQKQQLLSQKASILSQTQTIEAQIAVVDQQILNVKKDENRIAQMYKEGAATPKQLDDITGQLALIKKQKQANVSQLGSINKQAEAVDAQINVLQDRIDASIIKAPIDATILERYCEIGELALPGKAVFKIANIESLLLRVYISETQLSQVKLGQKVKVSIDHGDDSKEYVGVVEWVSSEAEFTPKIIQTKEERVKLVYAMKVRVENDDLLKIGMPGEVIFEIAN